MAEEKKIEEKKINEEELNDVNGGGWYSSEKLYSSGDEPYFEVGEEVVVKERNFW